MDSLCGAFLHNNEFGVGSQRFDDYIPWVLTTVGPRRPWDMAGLTVVASTGFLPLDWIVVEIGLGIAGMVFAVGITAVYGAYLLARQYLGWAMLGTAVLTVGAVVYVGEASRSSSAPAPAATAESPTPTTRQVVHVATRPNQSPSTTAHRTDWPPTPRPISTPRTRVNIPSRIDNRDDDSLPRLPYALCSRGRLYGMNDSRTHDLVLSMWDYYPNQEQGFDRFLEDVVAAIELQCPEVWSTP